MNGRRWVRNSKVFRLASDISQRNFVFFSFVLFFRPSLSMYLIEELTVKWQRFASTYLLLSSVNSNTFFFGNTLPFIYFLLLSDILVRELDAPICSKRQKGFHRRKKNGGNRLGFGREGRWTVSDVDSVARKTGK